MCVLSRSTTISRAARDRDRSRQHRHPALRHAGRPLLPRLLRRLLLSAALRLLRPAPAAGEATARQCCRQRRCGRGSGTHVAQIRHKWRKVRIVLRADSGFANEELMAWCEANRVGYVFGLARNSRLEAALAAELAAAKRQHLASDAPARVFRDFRYRTLDSWSRRRRVVGKAEHNQDGANPRFVVTSLARSRYAARALYEDLYCARGEAENRIGEQFELFADRASSATMPANQLRMWFSAMAYVLVDSLRRVGLRHTQFADAAVATIRLKLLKLGAQVRSSVRRLHFALASG